MTYVLMVNCIAAGNSSGNATKKAGKKAAQPGPEGNGSTSVVSG